MIRIRATPEKAAAIRAMLRGEPARLLNPIGAIMLATAQRAFREQGLGNVKWPERYPGQTPKLNVAGAVADLATGSRIKQRRYEARPAGRDTGEMMNRLTFRVQGNVLQVGSDTPYAAKFHGGGTSSQPVTGAVKSNLAALLRRIRKRNRKAGRGGKSIEEQRLGFLFRVTKLDTSSPARPFVGVTDDARAQIEDAIASVARAGGP